MCPGQPGSKAVMRLLIVDDDAAVRRLVTTRLSKEGINVTSAAT
jgi:DNA-binding response OmpR family regulator